MRVGIYSPYLDICGGGEKYVAQIAEVLANENDVYFLVEQEPDVGELENRLGLKLTKINFSAIRVSSPFLSKIPYSVSPFLSHRDYSFSKLTKDYDLFINQEHFSTIPSKAKLSVSIQEIPPTRLNFPRYNPVHKILFDPKLKTYDKIVTNSNFTKKWIEEWYKRAAEVLYPPVDTNQFSPLSKQNFVLSVGRFFEGGHCKKQCELIKTFKELSQDGMRDWELHLVGGVGNSIRDRAYMEKCQKEARGSSIHFHVNASISTLTELYGKSKIFWCATGFGEDYHPYRMEHFGLSTVEAMSAGCVPVVINRGGQPETVRNNIDGFCWNNIEELRNLTLKLVMDNALLMKMSESSIQRSKYYGMDLFPRKVKKTFSF